MSWVSYSKLQTLCQALRNKFTTGEMVIANDDKSIGAHLNHTAQDGLVTISPITEDGVTPAALWVTDSAANNATELTGGTLTYVTDNGKETEDYTSLSLVGGVVNVSGKSGAQRRITNVADPVDDNDAVNKKTIDSLPVISVTTTSLSKSVTRSDGGSVGVINYWMMTGAASFTREFKKGLHIVLVSEELVSATSNPLYGRHILTCYSGDSIIGTHVDFLQHRTTTTSYFVIPLYFHSDTTSFYITHQVDSEVKQTAFSSTFTLLKDYYLGD